MSVTELKALVYDQLALIEQSQRNIQIINAELQKRNQPVEQAPLSDETTDPTPAN